MDKKLIVIARIVAQADKVEPLKALLAGLVSSSLQEAGCHRYQLHQNNEDPTDFTFVEEWESAEALQAHMETDHFQAAAGQLPGFVAAAPDIRTYQVVV